MWHFNRSQKTTMSWSAMFFNSYIPETGSTVFRPVMMNQDASRTTMRDQQVPMVCVNWMTVQLRACATDEAPLFIRRVLFFSSYEKARYVRGVMDRNMSLIYSLKFVIQQIRQSEESIECLSLAQGLSVEF